MLFLCSVEEAESGSGCLLCGCLLLPPDDFLALCSRLRWYRLTVSLRSISSCSACACWYLFSQFTWCLRQPSIRCLSLSTTVLCLGMPTAPAATTLPAAGFMLLLMQILPLGPAAGEAKSPITRPSGCYFGRTFLPVKLTATTATSSPGHLHLHHLVSSPSRSSPAKGPKQPDSGRNVRPKTAAEASNNRGGLKGFEPSCHMVKGSQVNVSSSLLGTVSKQTAPENTNYTQPRVRPSKPQTELNNKAAATLLTTTPLKKTKQYRIGMNVSMNSTVIYTQTVPLRGSSGSSSNSPLAVLRCRPLRKSFAA